MVYNQELVDKLIVDSSIVKEIQNRTEDDLKEQEEDVRLKRLINDNYELLIGMRKDYADKIFDFIKSCTGFVFIILLFDGLNIFGNILDWETTVIVTLISTTLAQVFGLMFIVLHYVFPNEKIKN
jgi:hypothetical protein